MQLRLEFLFHAAHRLPHYDGPCSHPHGHTYRLVVSLESPVDRQTGLAIDFEIVKRRVRESVLERVDHRDLNEILDNPTAENIVVWIWKRLAPALPGLTELALYETPDCAVVYRGESDDQKAAEG